MNLVSKAIKKDEVPIAALIEKDGKVISKAYNMKNIKENPMLHAEIIAINKATRKLKTWRLSDCNMYVTLKPCQMCEKIIQEARIENVFYLLNNDKKCEYKTNFVLLDNPKKKEFKKLLTNFFQSKR